ncbi:tetratricopeptide repeat-containing sensor histidine kinase [Maribacter sp. MAR_2009_72]|uniref:tetratricopeptide repeat-containing sensor histidine kinase n=1 Tax=Maribacter sp. MAR_2009_72 TaxID=1250050 RepID=UPI0016481DDD|nr:tetratricopeptide repeat-containing sensor histidine kinase [Maribacter sp. MAR_2009_72]
MHLKSKAFSLFLIIICFNLNTLNSQETLIKNNTASLIQNNASNKIISKSSIDSLYNLTQSLSRRNADSALTLGHTIKAISIDIDYKKGIAMANEILARATVNKGDYDKGIIMASEALIYADKINVQIVYLNCINVLGLAHFFKRQLHKVFEYNQIGLKYAKKINNQDKVIFFSNNAGTILSRIGEYDKALEYYNVCLDMLEKKPDSVMNAQVLNNIGSLHYTLGEYEISKEFSKKSIAISSMKKMTSWQSDSHITLGNIAIIDNDIEEAQKQFEQSKQILRDSKDPKQRIETNLGFAKIDLANNNIESAKTKALNALQFGRASKYIIGVNHAIELLHEISLKQQNYKEAYHYLSQYNRVNDSLNIVNNDNKLKITLAENNLKYEQELSRLKINQKLATQNILIAIALISLIILSTALFYIRGISKTRKLLIDELNVKTLEQEKSKKELIVLNTTKDKLFSIIGHDLKGPMGSLQSLLNLLISGHLKSAEFLSFIPVISQNVGHLNFTMNNLLSWATTQMNGTTTKPIEVALQDVVENNFTLKQTISTNKSITMTNNITANTVVWADKDHVDIILRNLISNALKFTPNNGTITVNAKTELKFKIIAVSDDGVGMTEEVLNKIFKSNENYSTYGTDNEKGTGLGLTICKELVEGNHGKIWVESIPNVGSTFYFSLPITKDAIA